jgi:hypothetical protein
MLSRCIFEFPCYFSETVLPFASSSTFILALIYLKCTKASDIITYPIKIETIKRDRRIIGSRINIPNATSQRILFTNHNFGY